MGYDIFVPMKWLGYLFAFYMLLLSGIPCEATDDCCMGEAEVAMVNDTEEHCTGSKEPEECPCSPLFACGSSTGGIVANQKFLPETIIIPITPFVVSYIAQPLDDYSAIIWQPPRLV